MIRSLTNHFQTNVNYSALHSVCTHSVAEHCQLQNGTFIVYTQCGRTLSTTERYIHCVHTVWQNTVNYRTVHSLCTHSVAESQ